VAAFERGALIEDAAWHWARPGDAPPSMVVGYGSLSEATIRLGVEVIAAAIDEVRQ
jgi:GntR family transcriptional regulator / MocR family aminotransferase